MEVANTIVLHITYLVLTGQEQKGCVRRGSNYFVSMFISKHQRLAEKSHTQTTAQ